MRVLITGSRFWPNPADVVRALDGLLARHGRLTVVHGACPVGVDATAATWARAHPDAVTEEPHPADWETHGRAAGPIRNNAMVATGADVCLAFIHDSSRGASHCANAAEKAGIHTVRHVTTTPEPVSDVSGTALPGQFRNGWAGTQVHAGGHVGPRSCAVCRQGLDDVDDRGTHPGCDPTPPTLPAPMEGSAMTRPDTNPLLTAALAAAARGWHVFPCRPDDKRPAVRDWENRATTDTARITRCWETGPYNVGIACGPSQLLVLDLDQPKPDDVAPLEWQIPGVHCGEDVIAVLVERAEVSLPYETHLVRTGRGGLHAYFAAPNGEPLRNTAGRLGWLVDTRAGGGYVIAAGSTVTGRQYTTLYEAPTAPLPSWIADRLRRPSLPPRQPVTVDVSTQQRTGYVAKAIEAEATRVANAPAHQHNHTLYTAAVALGQLVAGGALSEHDVRTALLDASRQRSTTARCGCTEREADTTITSGFKAGARRPRTVGGEVAA